MPNLTSKKCVPCEGGMSPLTAAEIKGFMPEVNSAWEHFKEDETDKLKRDFKFKDFAESMEFVNKVSELAETENHHPDIHIWYSKAQLVLWTHAVGGLSENDFILAAKIDAI